MKKYLSILFIAFVIASCEDKIDLDVPEGPTKLVVDGILNNIDSIQKITLSNSAPYFESSQTPRVIGALVFVTTNNSDTINFTENLTPGTYEADYTIEDSTLTFTLHITLPDGTQYESFEEKLNRVPPIEEFVQSDKEEVSPGPDGELSYIGLLTTTEPKGQGDYYRWIVYVNGEARADPFDLIVRDDRLVDGNKIVEWDIVYELFPNDIVEIHQMSISQRAFSYWSLIFAQITNFGSPFDTPPAPVEGNVFNSNNPEERVLGFFGVSKIERAKIVVEKK